MNKGEILIYQTDDLQTQIEVRLVEETVWLNQYQMAELFDTDRSSIGKHISNIYKTNELEEKSTCAKIAQVRIENSVEVMGYDDFTIRHHFIYDSSGEYQVIRKDTVYDNGQGHFERE